MRSHLLQSFSLSFLGQKSFFILAVYMIFWLSLVSHILTVIYLDEGFFICHGCDSLFFLKSRINIFDHKILSFLSELYFHLSFFFFYHLETLIKCVTYSVLRSLPYLSTSFSVSLSFCCILVDLSLTLFSFCPCLIHS